MSLEKGQCLGRGPYADAACTLLILRVKSIHFIVLIGLTVSSSTFNWISTFYHGSLFENQYANQYLRVQKVQLWAQEKWRERGRHLPPATPPAGDSLKSDKSNHAFINRERKNLLEIRQIGIRFGKKFKFLMLCLLKYTGNCSFSNDKKATNWCQSYVQICDGALCQKTV